MTTPTQKLSDTGVSIWLDDLSRERLSSGNLQELIDQKNVVGVTTNPSIFAAALSQGAAYAEQMQQLAAQGLETEPAAFAAMVEDVQAACDVFAPIYASSQGFDGRVSLEVSPLLARQGQATLAQAKELYDAVGRQNVMIKIPATEEGLEPIAEALAEGISVNVTLIFSLERYRQVINAYMLGLEKALQNGKDLSTIHSVASFFVSRVDTEIDPRLEAIGSEEALALRGKAGVANARLAFEVYEQAFASERWARLEAAGANRQRPLWASTGVKNPAYPATLYVTEIAAPGTVNTMPEATLEAVYREADIKGDAIAGSYEASRQVLDDLDRLGVSYQEVVDLLETEGLEKFEASWHELLATVQQAMGR